MAAPFAARGVVQKRGARRRRFGQNDVPDDENERTLQTKISRRIAMMSPFDSSGIGSILGTRMGSRTLGTRNFRSSLHVPSAGATPNLERVDRPESNPVPDVVAHTDDAPARPVATATVLRFPQPRGTTAPSRLTSLLAKPVVVGERRSPGFRPGDPRLGALASALLQVPSTFKTNEAAPLVANLLGRSPRDYRISHFRYDFAKLRVRNLAQRIGTTRRYRLTRIGRLVCEVIDRRRRANDLANARSERSYEHCVVSA